MKRILFLMLFPLLALTSCGPLTYTLPVEKRSGSSGNVDFEGTLPGIITLSERGDSDSALLSSLAIGMAERLEADLELDSGSIPVFSMFTDEVNLSDRSMVEYLHAAAGVEFLIVADSLHVGEFSVAEHNGRAYGKACRKQPPQAGPVLFFRNPAGDKRAQSKAYYISKAGLEDIPYSPALRKNRQTGQAKENIDAD